MHRKFLTHTSKDHLGFGKGVETVRLPFSYRSPSAQEKNNLKTISEGCYTVIDSTNLITALVGPLRPSVLLVISDGEKTIVGHLGYESSLSSFIVNAKKVWSYQWPMAFC